ncbi:hypothetical protein DPV90_05200 [Aggregatibacter aphrophilus]|nr:hypothetical protein DPV90_05200 [Aggregatibacter aphrophilus]
MPTTIRLFSRLNIMKSHDLAKSEMNRAILLELLFNKKSYFAIRLPTLACYFTMRFNIMN